MKGTSASIAEQMLAKRWLGAIGRPANPMMHFPEGLVKMHDRKAGILRIERCNQPFQQQLDFCRALT